MVYGAAQGRVESIDWIWNNWSLADLIWYADMRTFETYPQRKDMAEREEKAKRG